MTNPCILFADDDFESRKLVHTTLERAGLTPVLASDGAEALKTWRTQPIDLIILDVKMPQLDGLEVCRRIRKFSDVPVMMLTSLNCEEDILRGFDAGADDYIIKPFQAKELVARIQAILQRVSRLAKASSGSLAYGDLKLDEAAQRVTKRNEIVPATQLEFQLLRYLMQRYGAVVSKENLFQDVWGYVMPFGGLNLIEVAIRRLREKIEDDPSQPVYIQTVRGTGYRFGQ